MIVRELHGTRVPALGFGTYELLGAACEEGVLDALEIGYRHIDTARAYDNESEVGRALAASGLPREDLWVTSKVWFTDLSAGDVRASAEHSLSELGLDYLDLLLIHWPNSGIPLEETLSAMVSLREEGLIRHIGVSNFTPSLMCEALDLASILCNQVEFHPFLGQTACSNSRATRASCLQLIRRWRKGKSCGTPILEQIGRQHGKNPGQVALPLAASSTRTSRHSPARARRGTGAAISTSSTSAQSRRDAPHPGTAKRTPREPAVCARWED
jgi:diketogulonate reductase-like aldo/keto reductase